MPYRADWEERVRAALETFELMPDEVVTTRKMFGGICFLLNGKMWVCVGKERLLARALDEDVPDGAEPMLHNGRIMKNFFYLREALFSDEEKLLHWMRRSAEYLRKTAQSPSPTWRSKSRL